MHIVVCLKVEIEHIDKTSSCQLGYDGIESEVKYEIFDQANLKFGFIDYFFYMKRTVAN